MFPIPDGLESRDACSMLCGGLTVYSPLVRNGVGPGKKVGVVGIGGLVRSLSLISYSRIVPLTWVARTTGTLCRVVREGVGCGGLRLLA